MTRTIPSFDLVIEDGVALKIIWHSTIINECDLTNYLLDLIVDHPPLPSSVSDYERIMGNELRHLVRYDLLWNVNCGTTWKLDVEDLPEQPSQLLKDFSFE